MKTPRKRATSDSRQQILNAAAICFAEKGYHRTTMDDIVRGSGLSKGSLYWHFDSKKAVLLTLAEGLFSELGRTLEAIEHADLSAAHRLEAMVQVMGNLFDTNDSWVPLMMEFWGHTFRDEDVQALTISLYQEYRTYLSQLVQEGMDSGEFRHVDAFEVASTLIGVTDGLMVQWAMESTTLDFSSALQTAVDLILEGLLCPAAVDQS
jgi:AcrR family transcriptional regulator